jgi:DNA replication protein DnaC
MEKKNIRRDKDSCECEGSDGDFRRERNLPCPRCQPQAWAVLDKKYEDEKKEREEKWQLEQLEQRKIILLEYSGLPPRMRKQNFNNYEAVSDKQREVLQACLAFADDFPARAECGQWLLLYGPCGTGKGHLVSAIGQAVMERHVASFRYVKMVDFVAQIKNTWSGRRNGDDGEEDIISALRDVRLLAIDEIGVQFASDAERLLLYRVLDNRYEFMLPTILTSNLTLGQLKQTIGVRLFDRLCEPPNESLFFNWPSHRQRERLNDQA